MSDRTQDLSGVEFRQKLLEGVEKVESLVTSTMGTHGRIILIKDKNGMWRPTKDGVSVAESIKPDDPFVALGSDMAIDGAMSTVRIIGDGTTTTTLFIAHLFRKLISLDGSLSRPKIRKQLEVEKAFVLPIINELKQDNITRETLYKVAMVSSNHDEETSRIVSEIWDTIGSEGVVQTVKSDTEKTTFEVKSGYRVQNGYVYDRFANKLLEAIHEDALVFVTDHEITGLKMLSDVVSLAMTQKKPLVVFAPSFENTAIQSMLQNHVAEKLSILPIEWPSFGDSSSIGLELASISNGVMFSQAEFPDLSKLTIDDIKNGIGRVDKVSATATQTIFEFQESERYKEYVKKVEQQKSQNKSKHVADKINLRLARLQGKLATIRIHGETDAEYEFRYDVYDDCIKAVKNAMQTGHVAGGGATYRYLADKLADKFGDNSILRDVLLSSTKKLLLNYGLEEAHADALIHQNKNTEYGFGLNLNHDELKPISLLDEGIIEPAGLVSACISNACSTASLLFNTEAGIVPIPELSF